MRVVAPLVSCLILSASLLLTGCEKCGGLGERGEIPEAPLGAADDTVKFIVDNYVSISYIYDCLNGQRVNIYYESGGAAQTGRCLNLPQSAIPLR